MRAKYVRFVVEATNNAAEPCVDELEVYTAASAGHHPINVALSANGGTPSSSGTYPGNVKHKLEHINDGQYGNSRSWISNERGRGWVAIEFSQVHTIDRVVWGRDRLGAYADRLPVRYRIEVAVEPGQWTVVAHSGDRATSRGSVGEDERPAEWQALEERRLELLALINGSRAYAGVFAQPPTTHRLYRGDPGQPREVVKPGTVTVLGSLGLAADAPEQARRLAFAKSLADPEHPLTARVMANRIWQYHFGEGLVTSPSDFGRMGVPPTHPELLDYLASRFVESGWSIKEMHRLILHSSAFRQDSAPRPEAMQVDAGSALLWRFPTRRYEAEVIRDNILLASGKLDLTMYGPGFELFLPNENYVRVYEHKRSFMPEDYRRMVYAHQVRMERDLTFGSFDCPDGGQSAPKRSRSTTALQALSLYNSPFVIDQAAYFADRLRDEAGEEVEDQIQRAYDLLYGREATSSEIESCKVYAEEFGLEALCRVLFNTNEFLFVE